MEMPISRITLPLIVEFIHTYCTIVQATETDAYVENMMDNHEIITVAGVEFYMPKDCSLWGPVDEQIVKHLKTYCTL